LVNLPRFLASDMLQGACPVEGPEGTRKALRGASGEAPRGRFRRWLGGLIPFCRKGRGGNNRDET
jgi:hypothetical protein